MDVTFNSMKESITAVVPAVNEAATIAAVVKAVGAYTDEIIVADGHSTDGTAAIARSLGARVMLDRQKGNIYTLDVQVFSLEKD